MTHTLDLNRRQIDQLINKFIKYKLENTTEHMLFRGKINKTTITIFKTNKVLIQGTNADQLYKEIALLLKLEITQEPKENNILPNFNFSIIGTDEVGTGDYFGPIIVAACFVPKESIIELRNIGVMDSKKLSDKKIIEIAPILINSIIHGVVLLNNEQYNEVSKTTNMNKVKAIMHNEVINKILKNDIKYDNIIVDGFTTTEKYYQYLNNKNNVIQNVKLEINGEDKYIAIAAASIIARYYFIKAIDKLSLKYHYNLPKGAGKPVDETLLQIFHDNNKDLLIHIAKLNFKNTTKIKL